MPRYDLLFKGETTGSTSVREVREKLAGVFKLNDMALDKLFCGKTCIVKKGVSKAEALALGKRFLEAGAICRIREIRPQQDFSTAPLSPPTAPGFPAIEEKSEESAGQFYLEGVKEILERHAGTKGLYLPPAIPEIKWMHASTACGIPQTMELLGLIDCTVGGSAKHCLAFCADGLHYSFRKNEVGFFAYSDFLTLTFEAGAFKDINLPEGRSLDLSGTMFPRAQAIELLESIKALAGRLESNETVQEAQMPPELRVAMKAPDTDTAHALGMAMILAQSNGKPGVFLAPDIPDKKLSNAKAVCFVPPGALILGLIDCTVFGSAKECLLFSDKGMHYRFGKEHLGYIPYADFAHRKVYRADK